jgi:hypothetical protein
MNEIGPSFERANKKSQRLRGLAGPPSGFIRILAESATGSTLALLARAFGREERDREMTMMKQLSSATLAVGFLVFGATVSQASTIVISDVAGVAPTFTATADITDVAVLQAPGSLTLSGVFHIPFGNGTMCNVDGGCDQSFNVLEASDLSLSDTLHLVFNGPGGPGGSDWQEGFTLTFLSDPGVTLLPGASRVIETGLPQFLPINNGGVGGGTSFNVSVLSDEGAVVPEPASLILLGTGLSAVAARRRLKRRA